MDCVIETEPTEYFVEVEFWEEFPLRKFFTTKWSTHINRQFIYKSDAASPHQGTNRESEKISKWIGRQHWFFVSLSLSSLRVVRLVVKNLMFFISELRQNYDKHSIQKKQTKWWETKKKQITFLCIRPWNSICTFCLANLYSLWWTVMKMKSDRIPECCRELF